MAIVFNTADLNPGKWFDIGEGASVCLRVSTNTKLRQITKQSEKKGKQDPEVFERLLWDYCILDWQGLQDADGVEIECTPDNKALLMGGAPDFAQFVAERLAELREAKLSDRDLEKN